MLLSITYTYFSPIYYLVDEIAQYLNGRVLSAMSSVHRALGFHDYPKHEPTCISLSMKTIVQMHFFRYKNEMTDMAAYLYRPEELEELTMLAFFKQFHYGYKAPSNGTYYTITIPNISKPVYIIRWIIETERLVRINMLYPTNGEAFWFRLLLRKRPVREENAFHYDGVEYGSLQATCRASGYLDDENEAEIVFNEAMVNEMFTPPKLRSLFIMLTAEGFPTQFILNSEENITSMTQEYGESNTAEKYRYLLIDFKALLRPYHKTLEDFGLHKDPLSGVVINLEGRSELEEVRDRMAQEQPAIEYNTLNDSYPNNTLQEEFIQTFGVSSNSNSTSFLPSSSFFFLPFSSLLFLLSRL